MATEQGFPPGLAPQQRLHPMSWLFELVSSLRQFIVPLVALVFFGRSNDYEWWPLAGVGVLAIGSVFHYFTYRYRIGERSLVVRSGLLQRHLREIPFARIQNVALHQSVLHRLFDVAEVRLESAGGTKPEAQMKVLKLEDAMALEALVRRRGGAPAPAATVIAPDGSAMPPGVVEADPVTLLALPPGEVLRLGLVSNRGLLVLGGAFAAMSQFDGRLLGNLMEYWGESLFGWAESRYFDTGAYVLAAGSLVVAFLALMRVLSVLIALLQYFGFRLVEQGRRLTTERGLLSRLRTSVPRRRIQAWTLEEGLVHRLLRRRSLHVDTATGNAEGGGPQRGFRDLAPIATPDACDALVRHLLPRATWPMAQWSTVHRLAWVRLATGGVVLSLLAATLLGARFGAWGLPALAWIPWSVFVARRHAARAGYARDAELVAWRAGWWSRHWRFAEIGKIQALRLSRSPLDRLYGMATLHLDTAGAGAFGPPVRMRYLAADDARALYRDLGVEVARRRLHW